MEYTSHDLRRSWCRCGCRNRRLPLSNTHVPTPGRSFRAYALLAPRSAPSRYSIKSATAFIVVHTVGSAVCVWATVVCACLCWRTTTTPTCVFGNCLPSIRQQQQQQHKKTKPLETKTQTQRTSVNTQHCSSMRRKRQMLGTKKREQQGSQGRLYVRLMC